jgi:hypothetical protein
MTESRAKQNPRVAYRDLAEGEGALLLHLDTGEYHGVNSLGAKIWVLLDGTRTHSAIVTELASKLATIPPTLDDDVASFLSALRERDLVLE